MSYEFDKLFVFLIGTLSDKIETTPAIAPSVLLSLVHIVDFSLSHPPAGEKRRNPLCKRQSESKDGWKRQGQEDDIREWTTLEYGNNSKSAVTKRENMENIGYRRICHNQMTLNIYGTRGDA